MAESVTVDPGGVQGRRLAHRRYASRATVDALLAAGRCERIGPRIAQTYDVVTDAWTEWQAVPDDDPRMNTVEHLHG